jgi:DNA-binding MarR family transcriptional regulator
MAHQNLGRTPAGKALFDVVVQTTHTFFRMRAVGAEFGAVTSWGGSTLGVLQTLKTMGPHTVPQIARMRPVARQHIQKLANEMAADGLIEFIDNPAHKRSQLLKLTAKGEARFEKLSRRFVDLVERCARDMDEAELRTTAEVLKVFRARLEET